MITFDAFLVFLIAASIPVIYLFIVRQVIEGRKPSSNAALKNRVERGQATDLISHQHGRVAASH